MSVVIEPQQVNELLRINRHNHTILLIDLRAQPEQSILGAKFYSSHQVIQQADQWQSIYQQVFLVCQNGKQSKQLAELLGQPFVSITGGFDDWLKMGLPVIQSPVSEWHKRYQHQIKLPGFGEQAQQKLQAAHVVVVGAGGLGAPALLYLVSSGIGTVTLIDNDHVSLSNLHRQIIYKESDVGHSKVEQAQKVLAAQNSQCQFVCHSERLTSKNAKELLQSAHLVLDGSDNYITRHIINDFCSEQGIPWLFAAVAGFELHVAFWCLKQQDVCFECLFPKAHESTDNDCHAEGVLGTVPGIAALIQVTEAIKYLAGMETKLQSQMISYNLLTHRFKMLKYPPELKCPHR
jgi:molybdopterin/thiamine biosynthesis adenylyltransferase/rhodanese-related sulfurtransferase